MPALTVVQKPLARQRLQLETIELAQQKRKETGPGTAGEDGESEL